MTRDNKLIMLALFLWGSGEGLFVYILPLYMERLGATPEQVGAVLAIAALLTACSFMPGGWLADRFDPKKIMIVGWLLGSVASIMMGLASDWRAFIPGVLIYNLSLFCVPAINTYAVEASTSSLEKTLTQNFAAFAAGGIWAPFVGGRLSESIGTAPLFLIAAAIFFTSMIVTCMIKSHAGHGHRSDTSPAWHPIAQLKTLKAHLPFFAQISFVCFAMSIGSVLIANTLGAFGWSLAAINTLGGTSQAIGMTLLAIGLGRIAARQPKRGLLVGQALGFAAMLFLFTPSIAAPLPVMIGYFLIGSLAPVRELANAQIARQIDRTARGLALGVNETLFALARSLAAALAGVLFTIDVRWPIAAALIAIPIGMIITALLRAAQPTSTERIIVIASNNSVIAESLEE
jgi:predicted MFS family arabinose efflux permease